MKLAANFGLINMECILLLFERNFDENLKNENKKYKNMCIYSKDMKFCNFHCPQEPITVSRHFVSKIAQKANILVTMG